MSLVATYPNAPLIAISLYQNAKIKNEWTIYPNYKTNKYNKNIFLVTIYPKASQIAFSFRMLE